MPMLIPSEVPLTQRAFDFLANLVYQRSHIRLGADKHTLVAGRLLRPVDIPRLKSPVP